MGNVFPRHPSDLDWEAAGMGITALPRQCARLLSPHAVKYLGLISCWSASGFSFLQKRLQPAPSHCVSPWQTRTGLNSHQIPTVWQRHEQEVHFVEAGLTPAALLGLKPSDQVPTILVTQEELAGGTDGGWHDLDPLLKDSSHFNKPRTVSAAPRKSMLESTSFRPINC